MSSVCVIIWENKPWSQNIWYISIQYARKGVANQPLDISSNMQPSRSWTPGTQNLLQNRSLDKIRMFSAIKPRNRDTENKEYTSESAKLILVHPTTGLGIPSWPSRWLCHDDLHSSWIQLMDHINFIVKKNYNIRLAVLPGQPVALCIQHQQSILGQKTCAGKISKVKQCSEVC